MFVGSLAMYIKHYAIDNDVFTTVVVQCDMISSAICFKYARVNFQTNKIAQARWTKPHVWQK